MLGAFQERRRFEGAQETRDLLGPLVPQEARDQPVHRLWATRANGVTQAGREIQGPQVLVENKGFPLSDRKDPEG